MNPIQLILILGVTGFLLWLINTYVPMQDTIKKIINVVVVVVVILWLLQVFGLLNGVQNIRVGR